MSLGQNIGAKGAKVINRGHSVPIWIFDYSRCWSDLASTTNNPPPDAEVAELVIANTIGTVKELVEDMEVPSTQFYNFINISFSSKSFPYKSDCEQLLIFYGCSCNIAFQTQ